MSEKVHKFGNKMESDTENSRLFNAQKSLKKNITKGVQKKLIDTLYEGNINTVAKELASLENIASYR